MVNAAADVKERVLECPTEGCSQQTNYGGHCSTCHILFGELELPPEPPLSSIFEVNLTKDENR